MKERGRDKGRREGREERMEKGGRGIVAQM